MICIKINDKSNPAGANKTISTIRHGFACTSWGHSIKRAPMPYTPLPLGGLSLLSESIMKNIGIV